MMLEKLCETVKSYLNMIPIALIKKEKPNEALAATRMTSA
jgi:hypothetical protein